MAAVKVMVWQKGGKKLQTALSKAKLGHSVRKVEVGFYSSARYRDGTPVTNVAAWNEFGTKVKGKQHIPPRPYFRQSTHRMKSRVRRHLQARVDPRTLVVTRQMGEEVGQMLKNDLQKSITQIKKPPNAKITVVGGWMRSPSGKMIFIKGKKSKNPLIDSGFLRMSATYKVIK